MEHGDAQQQAASDKVGLGHQQRGASVVEVNTDAA
jgi:hypothetical protein